MLERIKISEADTTFIRDGGFGETSTVGCGSVNNDGHLYYIDREKMEALRLPDKYKDTPIILYHPCGGYQDGLIMVSLMGKVNLKYYYDFSDTAGMWGWIDLEGNEVIPPQYIFAMSFCNGRAIVAKGTWRIDEQSRYWADDERWGIIDKTGKEIVPCQYDEIYDIEDTDRFILCHKGGWESGKNCVYDLDQHCEIMDMDFYFDNGYMFNSCFYSNGCICYDEHIPGEEKDYLYAYSVEEKRWVVYKELYETCELNGQTKIVVNKDGKDIIVF